MQCRQQREKDSFDYAAHTHAARALLLPMADREQYVRRVEGLFSRLVTSRCDPTDRLRLLRSCLPPRLGLEICAAAGLEVGSRGKTASLASCCLASDCPTQHHHHHQ